MSLWGFSTRSTGPVASAALWTRRNKAVWPQFRNSRSQRSLSTMKISRTRNVANRPEQVVHFSLPKTTRSTCVVQNQHISTQLPPLLVLEEGQTQYNKHLKRHQHEQVRRCRPSPRLLERAIGSLHPHSADHLVRWNRILGRTVHAAGRIVRLAQRMCWKCLIILRGGRVLGEVLRNGEGAETSSRRPILVLRSMGTLRS